ncbi:ATP-binding cassette domain-containing protein [Microbacterium saperdae]|uniref:ABC-2 type transport system ATP-binding protein n=1 Tax=Microbacterium saperdae TaxID=69368 RepID=A0A543BCN2_9MICO|nr:ATP-binding cassette domain-containing protein [Microbacterium saperdae]TQL82595.1 ABC-2 type transport system ATP-binding protein [Microbacterium saperdae]GGM41167.1 daunorubicin resistance protein DrrA family ABC transporter ATP-binding protein [Microbacterium saperdae]
MTTAIEVHGLRKAFREKVVVDDLDFSVSRGEVFALLGPNGAGKTTTINILTTLTSADSGSALVAGWDVRSQSTEVQRRISLTGQSAAVDDALSATENVIMFARLAGLGRGAARRRSVELIEQFDLVDAASQRVRTFSGGMRRRLDLALSFVVTPEVLFLDEPTTGLDTRSRRALWETIRQVAGGGTTVFLTTQYLEEADQLADRIAVLHDGRIAALGTPAALKSRVGGDTVELHDVRGTLRRAIPTDGSIADLRRALDVLDAEGAEGTVSLRRPSLDDVFLAVTSPTHSSLPMKEHA